MITQNVTGVNLKQINISPVLSSFAAALTQAKFYENYRVTRVHYRILPLDVVNMMQGANTLDLCYVYTVPTFNSQVPLASESSYLGYRECSVRLLQGPIESSFAPYVSIGGPTDNMMMRSPKLSCSNPNEPLFGHSLLFVKRSNFTTDYKINIFITLDI